MNAVSFFLIIGALWVRDTVSDPVNNTGKVTIAVMHLADGSGQCGTIRIYWRANEKITVSTRLTHLKKGRYTSVVYPRENVDLSSCTRMGAPIIIYYKHENVAQWLIEAQSDTYSEQKWTGAGVQYDGEYHLLNRTIIIYSLPEEKSNIYKDLLDVNNTMTPIACGVIRDINDTTEILPVTSTTTTSTTTTTTKTTRRPTTTTTTMRPTRTTPPVDPTISPTVPRDDDYSNDHVPNTWLNYRVFFIVSFCTLLFFFCRYGRCHCVAFE